MDPANLQTAASYLNNLLLARGLLKDGKTIAFGCSARLSLITKSFKDSAIAEASDFGTTSADDEHQRRKMAKKRARVLEEAVRAQTDAEATVINMVHEMILRRDKEQCHLDTLSERLQSQAHEIHRLSEEAQRLRTKSEESSRKLAAAETAEHAAQTSQKAAIAKLRREREEHERRKREVGMVRQLCNNEVRKRDREIDRLKAHLSSGQRGAGNGGSVAAASITINNPKDSYSRSNSTIGSRHGRGRSLEKASAHSTDTQDPDYTLQQESTEFLTQLCQSLSDENDGLISVVRSALSTLTGLLGDESNRPKSSADIPNKDTSDLNADLGVVRLKNIPTSMEAEMDRILDRVKAVLTTPNYVPLEEVLTREEEIARLRQGWVRMEGRCKELIATMEGWTRRLSEDGTLSLEDVKIGLGLGQAVFRPTNDGLGPGHVGKGDAGVITPEAIDEDDESSTESSTYDPKSTKQPQADVGLSLIQLPAEDNPDEPVNMGSEEEAPQQMPDGFVAQTSASSRNDSIFDHSSRLSMAGATEDPLLMGLQRGQKRTSSPLSAEHHRSPKLTVQEKLRIAKKAADAAVLRPASGNHTRPLAEQTKGSPIKRTTVGGRPRRRKKSTLSADELINLMGMYE